MTEKHEDIELPFDIASLASDLKEIKSHLDEAIANEPESAEDVDLLMGVVDSLQDLIKGANPEKMDRKAKIALLAHFTLFQELVATLGDEEFYDDFDDEEEEEDADEESSS